jgi:hypothetical protein
MGCNSITSQIRSIHFAQKCFDVSAIEISNYEINYLKEWSKKSTTFFLLTAKIFKTYLIISI